MLLSPSGPSPASKVPSLRRPLSSPLPEPGDDGQLSLGYLSVEGADVLEHEGPCPIADSPDDSLEPDEGRRAAFVVAHQPLDDAVAFEMALEGPGHLRVGDL